MLAFRYETCTAPRDDAPDGAEQIFLCGEPAYLPCEAIRSWHAIARLRVRTSRVLPPGRIIVGYFGITRSLKFTVDSIRSNLIEPLERIGVPVFQVAHFNLPERISNPRSGEIDIRVDPDEHKLLDLDHVLIEPQNDSLIKDHLHIAKNFPDLFDDGYRSITNLCHQLRSLERLWSLICSLEVKNTDVIIFFRADLLILDQLDVWQDVIPVFNGSVDLIVPRWHAWGGLNDRLAICSVKAAYHYATRNIWISQACASTGALHAETLLAYAASATKLTIGFTSLRAIRMRANGEIADLDLQMLDSF